MLYETVISLASDEGKVLIEYANMLAEEHCQTVQALTLLRKTGKNAEVAAAAWDVGRLRPRAIAKLGPIASILLFDRDGYEMASSGPCSAYHAEIMSGLDGTVRHVVDLCGGVGIDAIAFAARGHRVTVYENDPARAEMAARNAVAAGYSDVIDVRCEDVISARLPEDASAAFFDPARRTENHRRLTDPEALIPPLSFIRQLRSKGMEDILVKLAPSSNRLLGEDYHGEIEFISDDGECKEALLRLGDLRARRAPCAVILHNRITITGEGVGRVEERVGKFLYEPDPAVIRAGLVGEVAAATDGWQLDGDVAYVMSDRDVELPFAVGYAIVEAFPFHLKRLQEVLVRLGAGRVVVKKRAVPIEPAELSKKLKLTGQHEYIIILTRAGKTQWSFIATRKEGLVE